MGLGKSFRKVIIIYHNEIFWTISEILDPPTPSLLICVLLRLDFSYVIPYDILCWLLLENFVKPGSSNVHTNGIEGIDNK